MILEHTLKGRKIQIRGIFFSRRNCNCTIVWHDFLRRLVLGKDGQPEKIEFYYRTVQFGPVRHI